MSTLEAPPTPKSEKDAGKNPEFLLQRDVLASLQDDPDHANPKEELELLKKFRSVIDAYPDIVQHYRQDPHQAVEEFKQKLDEKENEE